jgi:hypothetical protein
VCRPSNGHRQISAAMRTDLRRLVDFVFALAAIVHGGKWETEPRYE